VKTSKTILIVLLMSVIASLFSCYYDNEALLYPGSSCKPVTNPSLATDVMPILNMRCNNCHSGSSPSAGIKLDSYTEVMKSVNNNSLMGSITHESSFSPMPKNAAKMNSCEIQKIQDWITQGATNN
jgi:hypothetical protein